MEAIFDKLWPEADPRGDRERLDTAVREINSTLRQALSLGKATIPVLKVNGRRVLNATLLDVDQWLVQDALDAAATATRDSSAKVSALRAAVHYGSGLLLPEEEGLWAESPRSHLRCEMLNAVTQLSKIEAESNVDRALITVTSAIERIDPFEQDLWALRMSIEADAGRVDAVRRTHELMAKRLAEIDAKPRPQINEWVTRVTSAT